MFSRTNLIALTAAAAFTTFSAGCAHTHDAGHADASAPPALQPVSLSLTQGDSVGNILLATNPIPADAITSTADQLDELH